MNPRKLRSNRFDDNQKMIDNSTNLTRAFYRTQCEYTAKKKWSTNKAKK